MTSSETIWPVIVTDVIEQLIMKPVSSIVLSYLSKYDWFCFSFEISQLVVVQTQTTITQVRKEPRHEKKTHNGVYSFSFQSIDNGTPLQEETINIHCPDMFSNTGDDRIISCCTFDPKVIWPSTIRLAREQTREMSFPRYTETPNAIERQATFVFNSNSDTKKENTGDYKLNDGRSLNGCYRIAKLYMSESKKYLVSADCNAMQLYHNNKDQHMNPVVRVSPIIKTKRPLKWRQCAFSFDDSIMMIREERTTEEAFDDDKTLQFIIPTDIATSSVASIPRICMHEIKEGQQLSLPLSCLFTHARQIIFSPSERRMFTYLHDTLHIFSFNKPDTLCCDKVVRFNNPFVFSLIKELQTFSAVNPSAKNATVEGHEHVPVDNEIMIANWTYTGQCIHVQTSQVEHLEIDVSNRFSVSPIDFDDQKTEFPVQHVHSLQAAVEFAQFLRSRHDNVVTNGPFVVTVDQEDGGQLCICLFDWIHKRLVKTVKYRSTNAEFAFQSAKWIPENRSRLVLLFYNEQEKRARIAVLTSLFLCTFLQPTYKTDCFLR